MFRPCGMLLIALVACSEGTPSVRLPSEFKDNAHVLQVDDDQGRRRFVLGNENTFFEGDGEAQFSLHSLAEPREALQLAPGVLDSSGIRSLPVLQSYVFDPDQGWLEAGTDGPITAPTFVPSSCPACVDRIRCDLCTGSAELYSLCAPCPGPLDVEPPVFEPLDCPEGWQGEEYSDGHRACNPVYPFRVAEPCQDDFRWDVETETCVAVAPCSAPIVEVPNGWSVDYVDAAAPPGGDGSEALPRNEPLSRYDSTVVVFAPGTYDVALEADADVRFIGHGTCTVLRGVGNTDPILSVSLGAVVLERIKLDASRSPAAEVASAGSLTLRDVSVVDAGSATLRSAGALQLDRVGIVADTPCPLGIQCVEAAAVLSDGTLVLTDVDVVAAVGISTGRQGSISSTVAIDRIRVVGNQSRGGVAIAARIGRVSVKQAWLLNQGHTGINIDNHPDIGQGIATLEDVVIFSEGDSSGGLNLSLANRLGVRISSGTSRSARLRVNLERVAISGFAGGIGASDTIVSASNLRVAEAKLAVLLKGKENGGQVQTLEHVWFDYHHGAGLLMEFDDSGLPEVHDAWVRDTCDESCPAVTPEDVRGAFISGDRGGVDSAIKLTQSHMIAGPGYGFVGFTDIEASDLMSKGATAGFIAAQNVVLTYRLDRIVVKDQVVPMPWEGVGHARNFSFEGKAPLFCFQEGTLGDLSDFRLKALGQDPALVLVALEGTVLQPNNFTIQRGTVVRPDSPQPLLASSSVTDCSLAFSSIESPLFSGVGVVRP